MRAWLESQTNWKMGIQYVIVPKIKGTNCPALIQMNMTRKGLMVGSMYPGDRTSEEEVLAWLKKFLNDD